MVWVRYLFCFAPYFCSTFDLFGLLSAHCSSQHIASFWLVVNWAAPVTSPISVFLILHGLPLVFPPCSFELFCPSSAVHMLCFPVWRERFNRSTCSSFKRQQRTAAAISAGHLLLLQCFIFILTLFLFFYFVCFWSSFHQQQRLNQLEQQPE